MTRNGLGLAVVAACGVFGLGAPDANADHRHHSHGRHYGGHVSYGSRYYRPVYAPVYSAPVVYAPPVTYVEPVSYYRPVTYVGRPVYYPPVRVVQPYCAPVRHYGHYGHYDNHRSYGGYVGSGGVGFSYASKNRGFSFGVGY